MNVVAIRTNSFKTGLTINAPADTVHHYDRLNDLTITAVDVFHSYHEHGIVTGKAIISQGHFEIEKNAVVPSVSVQSATSAVKVTANEQTTIMVDIASATKTAVVANAEKVYIAGLSEEKISGEKASTVVATTVVTTVSELHNAFFNEKPFVQLGADIELTSEEEWIEADTKLDLNGHAITLPSSLGLGLCVSGKTELFDSVGTGSIAGSGAGSNDYQYLVYAADGSTFVMNGGEIKQSGQFGIYARNSSVVINSGKITDCTYGVYNVFSKVEINSGKITGSEWGVTILGNDDSGSAELVMNGGEIITTGIGITGNGSHGLGGTSVEINGGKVSGELGIYQPQNGVLKVKGNAEISGETALYIKSGVSTISGGKFVATLTPKVAYNYNGNGGTPTGDAIVVDACDYPGGNPSVEVTIDNASFTLADSSAKNVAYYSHNNGTAVIVVNGQTLEPVIG